MLEIINNLKPFFEDCYRRIGVREYSKMAGISPPTASKLLSGFSREGLLESVKDRNYIFYYANKNSRIFADLARIYWGIRLDKLVRIIIRKATNPSIILFGSLSKAEAGIDSDVDLCVIGKKVDINLKPFEKALKRKVQLFFFDSLKHVRNPDLANNLMNGYILEGRLKANGF